MVKPIRDAMSKLVYHDDSQICYSETIHLSIDAAIKLRRASAILLEIRVLLVAVQAGE